MPADPVASVFTPPSRPARPLARPRGWDFLLRRFVRDHGVPVVLAALFVELQHARWITIVPVAPTLVIGSGRAGLLLAAVAAFVASSAFIRENQDYGVGSFLLTVVVAFALLPPIISDPFRYALGLRPPPDPDRPGLRLPRPAPGGRDLHRRPVDGRGEDLLPVRPTRARGDLA
ncbi:MAG: hypothetical protein HYY19_05295 [Candidatus Rokubacteria bacterium]|nr:hypothetical protein [Candidatus Rokubacteria bacterium]